MRNACIATIAICLAGCVHAPPKHKECNPQTSDIRVRIERDIRTDRIVAVDVLCDGRVIPQQTVSEIELPATSPEADNGK